MPQNTPASNTNKYYVAIEGYDISALVTEFNPSREVGTEEVTTGSGTTHEQNAVALGKSSGSLSLAYLEGQVPDYVWRIQPGGPYLLVLCPEGNVSGKPMHKQLIIIKKCDGPKQSVKKTMMIFQCDCVGADAPMVDMYAGGTVP